MQQYDEEFLEWIERVSLIPKTKPLKLSLNKKSFPHRNINEPMPITISDIHLIDFVDDKSSDLIIYGQKCRFVTFYGRASRIYGKESNKTMKYEIDDGLGTIRVTFKHQSDRIKNNQLNYNSVQMELSQVKYGMKSKNYLPKSIINNLQTLLKVVRKRAEAPLEYFKSGSKVLVIGFPIKFFGKTEIIAIDMFDDSGFDRTNELYFKTHLAKMYEEKYVKYSIDNKLIKE